MTTTMKKVDDGGFGDRGGGCGDGLPEEEFDQPSQVVYIRLIFKLLQIILFHIHPNKQNVHYNSNVCYALKLNIMFYIVNPIIFPYIYRPLLAFHQRVYVLCSKD